MKYLLIVSALLILVAGCNKDMASEDVLMEDVASGAMRTHSGMFINGPYGNVRGSVHIVRNSDGKIELLIEGLQSTNGPDLQVYISREIQPINFINLGALKSVNGTQVYTISNPPDFSDYKYALIHCRAFNHLFGSALLQKN